MGFFFFLSLQSSRTFLLSYHPLSLKTPCYTNMLPQSSPTFPALVPQSLPTWSFLDTLMGTNSSLILRLSKTSCHIIPEHSWTLRVVASLPELLPSGMRSSPHWTELTCVNTIRKMTVWLQRLLQKTLLLAPCSLLDRPLWKKTAALSWGHPSSRVGRPRWCKTRLTPTASIGSSATWDPSQATQLSCFWIPDTQKRGDQQMFTTVSSCQMLG